jgi:hypothetical protein
LLHLQRDCSKIPFFQDAHDTHSTPAASPLRYGFSIWGITVRVHGILDLPYPNGEARVMIAPNAGLENGAVRQPRQGSPWECGSRRLWSLWDMISFYAPSFFELAKEIGRITMLSDDVHKGIQDENIRKNNKTIMTRHSESFDSLGLKMCKAQTDRIIVECDKDT